MDTQRGLTSVDPRRAVVLVGGYLQCRCSTKVGGLGIWFVFAHREPYGNVHRRLDGRAYPTDGQST